MIEIQTFRRCRQSLDPFRTVIAQMTSWLSPDDWQALALSLRVALLSIVLSLPVALALAWLLSRKRFLGRTLVEALLFLPLILPPVVTGYALLALLGRNAPLGRMLADVGIVFAFRWTGAVIAAAVMGFPLLVLSIRVAFDGVDRRLEAAARNARRRRMATLRDDHAAAVVARHRGRLRARIRALVRRVRRDDQLRLEHSGRNAHVADRDLRAAQRAGRHARRAAAFTGRAARCARCRGQRDGDRRRRAAARALLEWMTNAHEGDRVDRILDAPCVRRSRARRRVSRRRAHARVVRRFGSGQDQRFECDRGPSHATGRPHRARRSRAVRQRGSASMFRSPIGASVTCFRMDACFRISTCARICFTARDRDATDARADFEAVVALLELAPLLRRVPSNLSGGERQRVAIGRALLAQPRALLLDEPLTGLHFEARRQVLEYLRRLKRELRVFTVLVTHHADEVAALADEVVLLAAGQVTGSLARDDFVARYVATGLQPPS